MRPSPGLLRRFAPLLVLLLVRCANSQTFLQPKVIATGNWPVAVYTQDVNADGFPDLIYIDQGATVTASTTHILLNDGRGNFTQSATLATAGSSLAFGNFSGAGRVDIGWITPDSLAPGNTFLRSYIAANSGGGTFAAPASALLFSVPTSFKAGYTTGASLFSTGPDAIVVEDVQNSTAYVIQVPLAGALPRGATLNLPDGTGPIILADLNGDGLLDIVIDGAVGPPPAAQIFLNKVNSFGNSGGPDVRFRGLTGIRSLVVQDVNLDGRADLIAEGSNGHIDVFFGNGDGSFQSASSGGTGPVDGLTGNGGHLIAVADLNHDSLPDAITATPIGISTLLGQGTAYLGLKGLFNAGPGRTSYAVADFNHDGNLDLALDSPEGIAILFGNPDGTFQTSQAFAAGQPALSSAVGVFTASGHLDAVVSTAAVQGQLLLGAGDGTFAAEPGPTAIQPGPAGLWSTVQAADINHDGRLDLIFTADGPPSALPTSGSGVAIQLGGGGGGFSGPVSVPATPLTNCNPSPAPLFGTSILSDFNGDGFADLAARDFNGFRIFNSTTATPPPLFFAGLQANPCAYNPHNLLTAADFTGDRIPDLIVESDGHLKLYPNTGAGQFPTPLGDLSVDGSLTTPGQLTAPILLDLYGGYVGTSSGGLGFPAVLGSLVAADLDGDGNQDLIATYANFSATDSAPSAANPNYIYIWYGSGNGKFLTSAAHPVNPVRLTPSRNFHQAAVADLNGDNIPDLILTDGYILSVQLGLGDGSFGPETHYLAGQGINSLSVADLRGSSHRDLLIANGGAYLSNPAANRDLPQANSDVNTGGVTVLLNATPNAQPSLLTLAGSITANPEPSSFGTGFYLTAVLNPPAGAATPSGTVTFNVDGTSIGTVTLNYPNGVFGNYPAPNTLAIGSHTITAVYSGDANYAAATFSGTHVVTAAATTGSITASPEPSVYGSAFTLTATGFGAGNYSFSIDGNPIGTVTSTTNSASIAGPTTTAVGTHTIAVGWTATGHALATVTSGTHVVTISPTTLSLLLCVDAPGSLFPCGSPLSATPLRNPVTMYYGQILDGVASESSNSLTGTIAFLDNTTPFCTINANLAGGSATNVCPITSGMLHAGSRNVTARYSGDTNNSPSTSNAIAVQVFPDTTTSTLTSSLNPSTVGQAVTFTVKVAGNFATPVGNVTFFDGLTQLGTGSLDANGQASFTTSSLTVGTHPIAVAYSGAADFNPAPTVILGQVVTAAGSTLSPTIVNLYATGPTTIYFNQPAYSSYSVNVANPSHPAYGTITVQDNGVNVALCTNIPNGSNCPYAGGGTLTIGVHSITVLYNGDTYNAPASSPPVVFTVLPDTTTATLTSSLNPAVVGSSVTFTAILAGNGGTLGATPPGSVNFLDGTTVLATVTLSSGTASFTTNTLALGTHPITVVYAGTANFLAVTSAVLNQVITNAAAPPPPPPPSFTLTVTPNPVTIAVGRDGVLSVTVTATGTFTQPIALTCSGLATQTACNFVQPLIPVAGGTTTLYLSTAAPHNCGDPTHPYFLGAVSPLLPRGLRNRSAALLLPASALVLLGLGRARRRLRRLALTLVLCTLSVGLLAGLSGCGACTDLGTRPERYTLTVTATPQDGSVQAASQVLNFTVILP